MLTYPEADAIRLIEALARPSGWQAPKDGYWAHENGCCFSIDQQIVQGRYGLDVELSHEELRVSSTKSSSLFFPTLAKQIITTPIAQLHLPNPLKDLSLSDLQEILDAQIGPTSARRLRALSHMLCVKLDLPAKSRWTFHSGKEQILHASGFTMPLSQSLRSKPDLQRTHLQYMLKDGCFHEPTALPLVPMTSAHEALLHAQDLSWVERNFSCFAQT